MSDVPPKVVDSWNKTETDMGPTVLGLPFPANCALLLSHYSLYRVFTRPLAINSGVAKAANVVAVKVLSDEGSGQNSDM